MKTKKEVAKEWKTTGGTCEVNSAGRIDQLGALRFKMKSESPIYSWESGGEFRKMIFREMRKGIPKEETFNKYGERLGKLKSTPLKNTGRFDEYLSRGFRVGDL